ncbi:ORF6N domain-containing protein [Edwardsiella tarda]|uniref:ORF6N domain-containing protein n=1 Tax=Edwardsiella tarda TaxID=636 RepID=UPI0024451E23|nr:ORF6N domain-containing protein [Edwardsiella tarda]WGE30488.1 ORF6N domain-containing protein [Edwardsiella tarda]
MNTVTINNKQLPAVEYREQRVVTFAMIDEVHNRPQDTARAAFNRNREHFIVGVDYEELGSDVIRTDLPEGTFSKFAPSGIVLFESGYLMLTKPFNDPLSWQVQRELVNSYFRTREPLSEIEMIAAMAANAVRQQKRLNQVEEKIENVTEAVENIKRGSIPAGWSGYSVLKIKSGMTPPKCKTLVKAYGVPTDTITMLTPDGQPRPMAIVLDAQFMAAFRLMMSEAEPRGTRWWHPKMGLFQAIGWEVKE